MGQTLGGYDLWRFCRLNRKQMRSIVIEPVSLRDLMRIMIGDGVASFAAIFHWDVVMGGVELGGQAGWTPCNCVCTQLQGVGLQ